MELEEKYLSESAVEEFDRIVREYERPLKRRRIFRCVSGIAAAAAVVLAVFIFRTPVEETPLSAVTIAETIGELMNLDEGNILSIEAKPQGSKAILTVNMKNGGTRTYIMTMDEETGATLLTQLSSTN